MDTIIDLAGGTIGGAGRFREQFLQHADAEQAIGMYQYLTPRWLVEREILARHADRAVAANNASFVLAGAERWVMSRNANHYLSDAEMERSEGTFSRSFRAQIPVVRSLLRRADTIVAPTSSMASRIAAAVPSVADRITVRFHPLMPLPRVLRDEMTIFVPVSPAPYKRMDERMAALQQALNRLADSEVQVRATLIASEQPAGLAADPRFEFCGRVPRERIDEAYRHVRAIYYPTDVESFGYPLAEARANGVPIIAVDNAHNHEVAGEALCGYREGDAESLTAAVERALSIDLGADPAPFDPAAYFRWLLG